MRLKADVEIVNRTVAGKRRAVHSSLAVGRKPNDSEVFIMHCTAQNRSGVKYSIRHNVEKTFTKFTNEGKATIRFSKPPVDMLIKNADRVALKAFLDVIGKVAMAKNGKELDQIVELNCSYLNVASVSQVTKDKTRMVIENKKDYPITTNFPHTLKDLKAVGLNLKRIDRRMLKLPWLQSLDLSGNHIVEVPHELSKMKNLRELRLRDSRIERVHPEFCTDENFCNNLNLLDLGRNPIKMLPKTFGNFTNLVTLNLEENLCFRLPRRVFSSKLQFLDLSGAKNLAFLPSDACELKLQAFNASRSSGFLLTDSAARPSPVLSNTLDDVPSLLDTSAKAVIERNLPFGNYALPQSLVEHLKGMQRCYLCGNLCSDSSCAKVWIEIEFSTLAQRLVSDLEGDQSGLKAKVEAGVCSHSCLKRDIKNHRRPT